MTARNLALVSAVLVALAGIAAACDDDATAPPQTSLDEPDSGSAEASAPSDASAAPDAKDPYAFEDEEVVCAGLAATCAKEIVAGDGHFCARMADGTVRCWGNDEFGNLGRPASQDGGLIDAPVAGLSSATQISAAGDTTCARLDDGGIRCWGANRYGELALSATAPVMKDSSRHSQPVQPAGVGEATRVDVGYGSVCVKLASGGLTCWGRADAGQLARPIPSMGTNSTTVTALDVPGPAAVDPLAIASVRGGTYSTLGLTESGDVWVWGAVAGEKGFCSGIGLASLSPSLVPRQVVELSKVTSLAVAPHVVPSVTTRLGEPPPPPTRAPEAHACAIAGGSVYCWGRSDKAALCTGLPDSERVPALAPIDSNAWPQRIAVAREITCVRMTDGAVRCCGGNDKGRLGLPVSTSFSSRLVPVESFVGHTVQVAVSDASVCALLQGGSVQCWGSNVHGELGTAESDDYDHPETHAIVF